MNVKMKKNEKGVPDTSNLQAVVNTIVYDDNL